MDTEEHTEEHTEDQVSEIKDESTEEPKQLTAAQQKLEKKRISMERARQARNKNAAEFKKEIEALKDEIKKKDEELLQKVVVENSKAKPKQRSKPMPVKKTRIIEEAEAEEDFDDEEILEKIIIRKKPKAKLESSYDDLVDKSYREQLQTKLNDERRKRVMAELFDF